jgi:nucleoside-diphosphate-sugar epimerase
MSSARSSVLRPRHTPRRHVLVTGADGFIGGHVARALSSVGHTVTGVVYGRAAGEGEVRVDLTVPEQLSALPHGVDAVVHAAGVVDPRAAHAMAAVNVGGTAALTAWSRAQRVGHFVQLSSVAVYGPLVLGRDRSEEAPRLGLALGLPYMRTKARAERVVAAAQVPYTLIRPPAVLGPGDTVITPGFVAALTGAGIPSA